MRNNLSSNLSWSWRSWRLVANTHFFTSKYFLFLVHMVRGLASRSIILPPLNVLVSSFTVPVCLGVVEPNITSLYPTHFKALFHLFGTIKIVSFKVMTTTEYFPIAFHQHPGRTQVVQWSSLFLLKRKTNVGLLQYRYLGIPLGMEWNEWLGRHSVWRLGKET